MDELYDYIHRKANGLSVASWLHDAMHTSAFAKLTSYDFSEHLHIIGQ